MCGDGNCDLPSCQALATLHEEMAIIHSDVKPSNALWDCTKLTVKLIDFGNAVDGPVHKGGMFFP